MRCLPRVGFPTFPAVTLFVTVCGAVGCSSGSPGAVGTAGTNAPFGVEIADTSLTVENRTGEPVVGGDLEIIPLGILPPFKTQLPRLEATAKRQIMFNTFHGSDGTPFDRRVTRAKLVKISGKDRTGKTFEVQVPFN